MTVELRWISSQSASCFYAADMMRRGYSLTGADPGGAIAEPVVRLCEQVRAAGLPEEQFWSHLVGLSAQIESNRELAEAVLRKTIGTSSRAQTLAGPLAGRIGDVESAASRAAPKLVDEVAEWGQPLQQQWRPRGDNLLKEVGRLTDERLIVSNATVVLVWPATGGGGTAHLLYNSVSLEAVQAEPRPELPELVRLAWLLSQLNVDLPIFSETIHRDRRRLVAAVSMLPPVLTAAGYVKLAGYDPESVRTALEVWHVDGPPGVDLAEVALGWWETYVESRPGWSLALRALDRMLE